MSRDGTCRGASECHVMERAREKASPDSTARERESHVMGRARERAASDNLRAPFSYYFEI